MSLLSDTAAWFGDGGNWSGSDGVPSRTLEHLWLSAVSVGLAALAALPLGLALGHLRKGGLVAMNVANLGRAVPSYALLVIGLQIWGLGRTPTVVALLLLALPPLLTNAYVGMASVPDELRDAARGMGMSRWQMIRSVELPVAVPLVMAGLRTSSVQVVATATIAALIGEEGLGRYIVDGIAVRDHPQVIAGALLVAALAIAVELGLAGLERAVTAPGLRGAAPDPVLDDLMEEGARPR